MLTKSLLLMLIFFATATDLQGIIGQLFSLAGAVKFLTAKDIGKFQVFAVEDRPGLTAILVSGKRLSSSHF